MQIKQYSSTDQGADENGQHVSRDTPATQNVVLNIQSDLDPSSSAASSPPLPIRILTHNIRYATSSPFEGELPWSERFPHLLSHLIYHTKLHFTPPTTIICLQEVLHRQLLDLVPPLHSHGYTHVGVGRDDGHEAGEYSPIFYRHDVWEALHYDTVWLNPTGAVGEKGWDAASVRIVTCLVLRHRHSGLTLLVMNTHLDDQGELSRQQSAKIIVRLAQKLRTDWQLDWWVLAGDLNSSRDPVGAWSILNRKSSGFIDASDDDVENEEFYGDLNTFTGFDGHGDGGGTQLIDFIHVAIHERGTFRTSVHSDIKGFAVLPNRFDNGVYISDHRAVVVDILLYPDRSHDS